jgi:DNA polymerase-1
VVERARSLGLTHKRYDLGPDADAADAARSGLLDHLVAVEMPWVVTNSRMGWAGVRVDAEKRLQIAMGSEHHLSTLLPRLAAEGVTNVKSHTQLRDYFATKGVLHLFVRGQGHSFDRDQLEEFKDRDPAIALIRAARRALDLRSDRLITGEFEGEDGRVHAEFRQLGTHTGRQSSRNPNLLGLGRVFRPLVVPEPGFGIGEVDLSQIEVGVAGVVYGDERLVAMFNTGDVYSAMAQEFYREELSESDRQLDSREFKLGHRTLRDRMKIFTLSLIYGVTALGLARQLGISEIRGAEMLDRFMAMFPTLRRGLAEAAAVGGLRGYASTSSGLRRHRPRRSVLPTSWERNWMTNHPVQGTACVAFKIAGNRLDRLYRRHGARLILALHDAYVYEAPLAALKAVGELTRRVMVEAVEELFPVLRPDAQVNDEHPGCWNKDGRTDSIDRWIEDPTYSL